MKSINTQKRNGIQEILNSFTVQKMKFCLKDFFSKCDQICSFQRIWSHLLNKSLIENFIFCAVFVNYPNFQFSSIIFALCVFVSEEY